jgi:hypothetical protein
VKVLTDLEDIHQVPIYFVEGIAVTDAPSQVYEGKGDCMNVWNLWSENIDLSPMHLPASLPLLINLLLFSHTYICATRLSKLQQPLIMYISILCKTK